MPSLRKRKDTDQYYVLTSISGQVITFQLSQQGQERLLAAAVRDGDRFDRGILFDLYRSGDAFTGGGGPSGPVEDSRQLLFDFSDDTTPETIFPSCSECASLDGLHVTATRDRTPHDAFLHCTKCRKAGALSLDISIPLQLVSRPMIVRLQQMGYLRRPDPKVAHYRDDLESDFQKKWDDLRKRKERHQEALFPTDDGPQRRLID